MVHGPHRPLIFILCPTTQACPTICPFNTSYGRSILQLPLDEALDSPCSRERVFLEHNLIVFDKCIRLNEDLPRLRYKTVSHKSTHQYFVWTTYLLLAQNKVTKLTIPSRQRFGQLGVEFSCTCTVGGALAHL